MKRRRAVLYAGIAAIALLALVWAGRRAIAPNQGESTATGAKPSLRVHVGRPGSGARNAALSGTVFSGAREPVAGARVCATCASCEPTATPLQRCATSDAQGRYALDELPPIGLRVVALAPGFAPAQANQGLPLFVPPAGSRSGVDIALERAGVELSGVVLDGLGGPVAGADVRLIDWRASPLAVGVTTDDRGRFTLWTTPGGATLLASAPGYTRTRLWRVAPSRDVELVLMPASVVEGVVVTAQEGRPVAGIQVSAHRFGLAPSPTPPAALTGADGRFRIEGLDAGEYGFEAVGQGYRGESGDVALIGLAETATGVTITVSRSAQVSGRVVVDGDGSPCPEGMVTLGRVDGRPDAPTQSVSVTPLTVFSEIGAEGDVYFDGVRPGRYALSVQCRGHRTQTGPDSLEIADRDIEDLVWRVERGLALTLRVVDDRDQPVPQAMAVIVYPESAPEVERTVAVVNTDAQGRHTTESNLAPGVYSVRPYGNHAGDPVEIALRQGSAGGEATLRLKGSGAIVVRVKTAEGAAVDGLSVEASALAPETGGAGAPVSALALGDGRYDLRALAAGVYRVRVSDGLNADVYAERANLRELTVASGQTLEASAVLARGGEIQGRVVDARGAPIADAWVNAESDPSDRDSFEARWRASNAAKLRQMTNQGRVLTDAEGHFRLTGIAKQATVAVRAELDDGSVVLRRGVAAGALLELKIPAPGTLRGVVTDAQGRAVPRYLLRAVETETGATRGAQFASPGGEFVLERVAPGRLALTALGPEGESAELHADLAPGQTLSGLRLAFRPLIAQERPPTTEPAASEQPDNR